MKSLKLIFISLLLSGCSIHENKSITSQQAETGLSQGYFEFEFDLNESNLPENAVDGKLSYTVHYTKAWDSDSIFLNIEDAPFKNGILKAYIPNYEDHIFYSMSVLLTYKDCEDRQCRPETLYTFIQVYDSSAQTRGTRNPEETIFPNLERSEYPMYCRGHCGEIDMQALMGKVYITPHFDSEDERIFSDSPFLMRASVGS